MSCEPLRILHVLDLSLPLHTGYAFRTIAILREQRARGWQTFHLTGPKQGAVSALQELVDGWTFERTLPANDWLSRMPVVKHWRFTQTLKPRLAQVVDAVRPDVIHVHSPVLNALPAFSIGRARRIPIVYEIRAFWEDAAANQGTAVEDGPRYRLTRTLETHAAQRADAVTTICEGLRGSLIDRGIPSGKITVIPNAVDVEQFRIAGEPDPELMNHYALCRGATLGFAGSFYEYEGLDVLLRAMPDVVRALPKVRLLLLGGGRQEFDLKQLSRDLQLEGIVHFIGRVPHSDMDRYYSVMDAMVYPRKACRLTDLVTPLKPLEAMAMGRTVIASDVGGHRELIRDGQSGYLFKAGSADALAQCIIRVLRQPELQAQVTSAARTYVETERNWRDSVARYEAVYARALNRIAGDTAMSSGGARV